MIVDTATSSDVADLASAKTRDAIHDALNVMAWAFFEREKDKKLVTVKKWGLSFSLTVAQIRPVFVMLFGEEVA